MRARTNRLKPRSRVTVITSSADRRPTPSDGPHGRRDGTGPRGPLPLPPLRVPAGAAPWRFGANRRRSPLCRGLAGQSTPRPFPRPPPSQLHGSPVTSQPHGAGAVVGAAAAYAHPLRRVTARGAALAFWELMPGGKPVSSVEEVKRRAQSRFAAAAEHYVTDRIHVAGDELDRMVELARLTGEERVLDVATGGGHTALAFAPHAREVIALDLTRAMLDAAARHVAERGAANVSFHLGDAEHMPFADGEFDVVTARFAPHHFPQPERFVAESARVLRPGGRLVIFDNMVPEDDELDAFMNRFEVWRDPSHFRAHRPSQWVAL